MTLGKGLESLIPPGGGQKPNNDGAVSQIQEEKKEGENPTVPAPVEGAN